MCQNTCFFGKRPELSLKKSRTMFFKADINFFWEFLDFFWFTIIVILKMTILIYFLKKTTDFQFFLQVLLVNFSDNFFLKWSFWRQRFWGIKFFSEIPKKIGIGIFLFWRSLFQFRTYILKKHCSGCFLKQLGSFFKIGSNLTTVCNY